MSKVLLSIVEVFTVLIPQYAFMQELKFARRPKKSDCKHPRNDAGKLIGCSGQYRIFRELLSGHTDEDIVKKVADTGLVSQDDIDEEVRTRKFHARSGFSITTFSASVGAKLGVETKEQKILFYVLVVLLGLDSHPASLQSTICGNASKWTRKDAFVRYANDFALYDAIPPVLMEWIEDCWKRVLTAADVERKRVIAEIKAERENAS